MNKENALPFALKYRPKNFKEVVGNILSSKILKNMILKNRILNGYLFFGYYGVGKTSLARIFSKALNCLDLKDGEPCNKCSNCVSINENTNLDFLEIDGASNNSVNDIRKIKNQMQYKVLLKYKVYIIDEVQMLSQEAFNALLKMLEESILHNVVFILCTTDFNKVPSTIVSRCSIHKFVEMDYRLIYSRLKFICDNEKIGYEEAGLLLLSKHTNSLRDAIILLDSISNLGYVSIKLITKVLKLVPIGYGDTVVKLLLDNRADKAINFSIEKIKENYKVSNLIKSILITVKDLSVAKLRCFNVLDGCNERKLKILNLAVNIRQDLLIKMFEISLNYLNSLKNNLAPNEIVLFLLISKLNKAIGNEDNIITVSDIEKFMSN